MGQEEIDDRLVELSQSGTSCLQLPTGDDALFLHAVVLFANCVALIVSNAPNKYFNISWYLPPVVSHELVSSCDASSAGWIVDDPKLQKSGVLDQLLDALRVVDAWKLHHNSLTALAQNDRLRYAEGVDPIPNRLKSLLHR